MPQVEILSGGSHSPNYVPWAGKKRGVGEEPQRQESEKEISFQTERSRCRKRSREREDERRRRGRGRGRNSWHSYPEMASLLAANLASGATTLS
ncbi:hypothetical protein VTK73DRAFT_4627 [Phialemonium thermophilum]|uniref:Uncharacterized protein n=1 Tax=Phialemonium thermophilum TaxID=223376 RepID=A0ABR3V778_9PEZI